MLDISKMIPLHEAIKGDLIHLEGKFWTFVKQKKHNIFIVSREDIQYQYDRLKNTLKCLS